MKRMMTILTALLLWCMPASAQTPAWELAATQLEQEMALLLEGENYTRLFAGWWEEFEPWQEKLETYTWQRPTCTVFITCDDAALAAVAADAGVTEPDETLLGEVGAWVVRTICRMGPSVVHSVLTGHVLYIDPSQPDGAMIFLRFYEDGAPILFVTTAQGGAVCMEATVLATDWGLEDFASVSGVQLVLDDSQPGLMVASGERRVIAWPPFTPEGATDAQRSASLAQELMRRMGDPAYWSAYGVWGDYLTVMSAWAKGDFSAPRMTLKLEVDAATHALAVWGDWGALAMTENAAIQRRLSRTLPLAFEDKLVSMSATADEFSAAYMIDASAMYADSAHAEGSDTYLLLYDGGHAVLVNVWSEHGAVQMSARYLPLPELAACQSAAEVSMWLTEAVAPVTCIEVLPE